MFFRQARRLAFGLEWFQDLSIMGSGASGGSVASAVRTENRWEEDDGRN